MLDKAPIIFSENGFQELSDYLKSKGLSNRKFYFFVDENSANSCLPILLDQIPEFSTAEVIEVESGEASKNLDVVSRLYTTFIDLKMDRSSILINLGGGVISDLGGFTASTYKRGIDFINIPTTLLAQVDASIGGKTGVNVAHYKNMAGTFSFPKCVFIYPAFLKTQSKGQIMSGFAELVKHALISDKEMWETIKSTDEINLPFIMSMVQRAAEIKQKIVETDPFEKRQRKKLNFGHTIGHALETHALENTGKDLLHGEAVALGILCESYISQITNELSQNELEEISSFIGNHYRGYTVDELTHHRLLEIMSQDKKKKGDSLNMTLLNGIGSAVIDQNPKADVIIDSLDYLAKFPFKA